MADIDKALPNEVRKEFEVPGEEEIKELALEEVEQEEGSPEPVDIQENEDGSLNINNSFFFGTFENIKNLITDFPHHSVNSHDMTAKKIKSLGLFVEPIPNLFIAPVRPNLIEITDKEKMSYWDIASKFLDSDARIVSRERVNDFKKWLDN